MKSPADKTQGPLAWIASGASLITSRFVYWAPVLLALGFFSHMAFKGLRPALVEERRLEREEAEMQARELQQLEVQRALQIELQALEDPIYQERIRRGERFTETEPALVDGSVPFSTLPEEL